MATRRIRRLVIDADVARSAGESVHPISSDCRAVLDTVRDCGHKLVMTNQIAQEWRKHRSAYTRKWQTLMYARKLIDVLVVDEDTLLRASIENSAITAAQWRAVEKDMHLVEAAIATDKLVVSKDEQARTPLKVAASDVAALKRIIWVNPTKPEETPVRWLEQGAKAERSRQLRTG